MKYLYVALVFMTLSHYYMCGDQTLSGFGVFMRGLLTSGFNDETDCGDEDRPIEEYVSFLFPNLMCDYIGIDADERNTIAFECLGGKRYLVLSYYNMGFIICNGADTYEKDLEVSLLDEDEFDDLNLNFNSYEVDCDDVYVRLRCFIYRQCEAYYDYICA